MAVSHPIITTDAEHKAALRELERLWNASLGQTPSEELQALIEAVVSYEDHLWLKDLHPPRTIG